MTDGDVVGADLRRHVEVSQGKLGRIERRIEIEVIHAHEETQVGVAGESAGKARVVVSGGCDRAKAPTTAAAPAAGRWGRKATHPGIRVGESTVLVAQEFGVKAVQGNTQIVVDEEGLG